MIRQRYPADRLFRIGAWTVAGITGTVAFLSAGHDPAPENAVPADATTTESPTPGAALPAVPESGLTILRVAPTTTVPAPPAAQRSTEPAPGTRSQPATAAVPAPPPPALSAAPAPIQSAGS
ncbi:MAG: hypothetical protein KJN71_06085 [Acidimicrobiia bacterium]|nr:hypothetical protein [Acidimicrobiia bacterium]NNC74461.1 hypothetical protein [Acidimicrobiia bacterium]